MTGMPANAYSELGKRMLGPFDEPLYMAYFTVILLNFIIAQYLFKRIRSRVEGIFGIIVIFLTQTRAIILGLIFSLFTILLKRGYRKYIALSFMFIIIVVFSFYSWFNVMVASTLDFERGSTPGHVLAYTVGILTILENPFGIGLGMASTAVVFSRIADITHLSTENAFINTAIEIGLPGLFILFVIFLHLFIKYRAYLKTTSPKRPRYFIVASSYLLLIQFVMAGFLAPGILTARILIPFMIILGWGYSIVNQGEIQ